MKPMHIIAFCCAAPVPFAAIIAYAWWNGNREARRQRREHWRWHKSSQWRVTGADPYIYRGEFEFIGAAEPWERTAGRIAGRLDDAAD